MAASTLGQTPLYSRKRLGPQPWARGEVCWTTGATKDTTQGVRHGRRLRVRIDGHTLQEALRFVRLDLDAWPLYYRVYPRKSSRGRKRRCVLVKLRTNGRPGWAPCVRSRRTLGVRVELDAGSLPSGPVIVERRALDNKETHNGAKKANGRNAQVRLALRVAEGTDVRDGGDQDNDNAEGGSP